MLLEAGEKEPEFVLVDVDTVQWANVLLETVKLLLLTVVSPVNRLTDARMLLL